MTGPSYQLEPVFGAPPERQNCLRSCSEGSSYPDDVSSTDMPECDPSPPITSDTGTSALAELASLLAAPTVRAWALARTDGANQAIQVGSGDAGQVVRRARLGTDAAVWAVVAQPRAELVALDIDECAELVVPEIRQAAVETVTEIVAAVASGRPDCVHLWCAPATRHGREELLRRVTLIRERHRLPAAAIDHRDGKAIRLPGSASLKPGGLAAQLIDLDTGAPADVREVIAAVRAALPLHGSTCSPRATNRRRQPIPSTDGLPLIGADAPALVTQAPRAWRRRHPFSPEEWSVLNNRSATDRSAAATAAAWVLWRHGIRSAAAALWWYQRCAAFDKFRHRDEESRRAGLAADWSACRQHWSAIASRARNHRPDIPESDRRLLAAAREEIRWWSDPDLQAAAAVLIDRFDDGHGLADRPIARRDLQLALHLSDGVAAERISALIRRGLLRVSTPWSSAAPREATRYDLAVPPAVYRGESDHDVTSPLVPLTHPLWGLLRHACRRALLTLLRHPGSPTRTLADLLHLPVGDASHGTLHLLHQLEQAGLALRSGTGRGTTWSPSPTADLDAAAHLLGADLRARELAARICGERACWHAETHAESARSLRGLQVLRARLTHSEIAGRPPRLLPRSPQTPHVRRSTGTARHPHPMPRSVGASGLAARREPPDRRTLPPASTRQGRSVGGAERSRLHSALDRSHPEPERTSPWSSTAT